MRRFENIATMLRKRRHQLRIEQTDLAKMVGFKNGQFISNIERGLCGIPGKKVAMFAIVLDLTVDELIEKILIDERNHLRKLAFGCPEAAKTNKKFREEQCQKTTQQVKPVSFATATPKTEIATTTFLPEKLIPSIKIESGTLSQPVKDAINIFMQNL